MGIWEDVSVHDVMLWRGSRPWLDEPPEGESSERWLHACMRSAMCHARTMQETVDRQKIPSLVRGCELGLRWRGLQAQIMATLCLKIREPGQSREKPSLINSPPSWASTDLRLRVGGC